MSILDSHFQLLIRGTMDGRVVPFLGGGASLCDRPDGGVWQPNESPPSGHELAEYLARENEYPESEPLDLARVSQYVAATIGTGPLYEDLHRIFDCDYPPTSLHRFLAGVPNIFRKQGLEPKYQLIITTNYDDLLGRAFDEAGEPYDQVSYIAEGELCGKFIHTRPDGSEHVVERPNEYSGLSLHENSVILKIHGAVHRSAAERDSYVITEDHYIDYLSRTDISSLLPVTLTSKLMRSHFLFLGYSLRDWNLRVILHRIWGNRRLSYKSWAIQVDPSILDEQYWRQRGVDILNVPLSEYVEQFDQQFGQQFES